MRSRNFPLLLLSGAVLAGCVNLAGKPPASLLTIASTATVAPGTVLDSGRGIYTLIEPEVPKSIDTVRVAVRAGDNSYAYVKDAIWVDTPKNMFRGMLAETIAARTGALVLDQGQYSADPGRRLMGELVAFGLDARSRQAVVTYDAVLLGRGGVVTKRRFSASVPVVAIDAGHAASAISAAANAVAADVADWLKGGAQPQDSPVAAQ